MVRLKVSFITVGSSLFINFNSKMVRLKVAAIIANSFHHFNFNSKMVRLKGAKFDTRSGVGTEFQFQNGTIKRRLPLNFHGFQVNFNSKMVRLKVCKPSRMPRLPRYFNSKMVRLKDILTGCE